MDHDPTPKIDTAYRDLAVEAVNAAFQSGYEQGLEAGLARALDRIAKAIAVDIPLPEPRHGGVRLTPPPGLDKLHPNDASVRRFEYGAISAAFREALRDNPQGLTMPDLIARAAGRLNVSAKVLKYRDTVKRLREHGEMRSVNGLHYPGNKLPGRNEGPNGAAARPSYAGGAATPPNESLPFNERDG